MSVSCGLLTDACSGDNRGCVDVYKIVGLDLMPEATREEQVERLHKALKKNVDD